MSIILESPASLCEEIGGAIGGVGILQGRSPTSTTRRRGRSETDRSPPSLR